MQQLCFNNCMLNNVFCVSEMEETMLRARDAKYTIPMRYGKVLFCGAAAAGKSNFLNLLMKENFQSLHISTEVLKPQQVAIATKALIMGSNNDGEMEFTRMDIDEEILQLESYLPKKYPTSTVPPQKSSMSTLHAPTKGADKRSSALNSNLALVNVNSEAVKKDKKPPGKVWDILTFLDTGGQPQFISMLPAVNSFTMITFIIHKMEKGGEKSLNKIVSVQYGNEKGEISFKAHPHKYTYLQLTETLISYASNILSPDTKFLDKLKVKSNKNANTRSIMLVGTHSGDDELSEDDIKNIDEELTKVVVKSGVNHIQPSLNKNYQTMVPVDNKKQGKSSETHITKNDTKRYTNPSHIRDHIKKYLERQDEIHVPIKWLLLELEIRKVCQQKNCNLISYADVLKLAKEKKLSYNGEFSNDDIDGDQFIKQGLRFHHSFGVLLYFEEVEGMQNLVIINHQWLFNKLSKIVEYTFTCETQEDTKELRNGIFKKSLLGSDCLDITKDFKDSEIDTKSVDPINAFLKLLEYLKIAAPSNENVDKYFMPCILDSCELVDLKEKVPQYNEHNIRPLLIQFKSNDNKTYSLPRGVFCFLIVELMVSLKWEPYKQTYVNLLTLFKRDSAHYVTLIDRIFCLEVHVTYKRENNVHDEVLNIINKTLHVVSKKLKIDSNLCRGFPCPCKLIKEMHISYLRDDNDKYCCCSENSSTDLTDSHTIWLKGYYKV